MSTDQRELPGALWLIGVMALAVAIWTPILLSLGQLKLLLIVVLIVVVLLVLVFGVRLIASVSDRRYIRKLDQAVRQAEMTRRTLVHDAKKGG